MHALERKLYTAVSGSDYQVAGRLHRVLSTALVHFLCIAQELSAPGSRKRESAMSGHLDMAAVKVSVSQVFEIF